MERLEKDMARLTMEVGTARFEDAVKKTFNENRNKFGIPGSREGKTPKAMIGKIYGEGIFYEDTADEAINATCMQAMNKNELETILRLEVPVEQIGKDKPSIYTATIATRPEVTLDEYKGIEVEKAETAVAAGDVDTELKRA